MWKTCMIKIFTSLKKKLKGNVRRWKDPSFLWINMINIAKNEHHIIKCLSNYQQNPHKAEKDNFLLHTETHTLTGYLKQYWIIKELLEVTPSDFKFYCRELVIWAVCYWHKNRYVDWWNKIDNADISPHTYRHLIFWWRNQKHTLE